VGRRDAKGLSVRLEALNKAHRNRVAGESSVEVSLHHPSHRCGGTQLAFGWLQQHRVAFAASAPTAAVVEACDSLRHLHAVTVAAGRSWAAREHRGIVARLLEGTADVCLEGEERESSGAQWNEGP
jgi:hypothetical protein